MRATVDEDTCIGCGLCPATCPEVFEMAENNKAVVIADPVPPSAEASADEAAQNCPVTAITIDS